MRFSLPTLLRQSEPPRAHTVRRISTGATIGERPDEEGAENMAIYAAVSDGPVQVVDPNGAIVRTAVFTPHE